MAKSTGSEVLKSENTSLFEQITNSDLSFMMVIEDKFIFYFVKCVEKKNITNYLMAYNHFW